MNAPAITPEQATAEVDRARTEIMLALAPLVVRHGAAPSILAAAMVVGQMIGMSRRHGVDHADCGAQLAAVHKMVACGLARETAAIQAPGGRA
jgi:hypothetical protein